MQRVTPLPFRIVDEINQGMDQTNERAVMTQLLQMSSSGPDGGGGAGGKFQADGEMNGRQLFIVSPKLLPDMVHADNIRTEIVLNGSKVGPGARPSGQICQRFMDFEKYARDLRLASNAFIKDHRVVAADAAARLLEEDDGDVPARRGAGAGVGSKRGVGSRPQPGGLGTGDLEDYEGGDAGGAARPGGGSAASGRGASASSSAGSGGAGRPIPKKARPVVESEEDD